ncbi:hypothetical protein Leryth_020266 [Lithospermum erythrorhizon]|nr:hypothetical protein Leryth_020266 [Lithospermum erythrorhizon]
MAEQPAEAAALSAPKRGHLEPENNDAQKQEKPNNNSIVSFLVNIFQLLPFPKVQPKKPEVEVVQENVEELKPTFVKFPKKEEFPSLKFEAEGGDTDTNPLLLYQVYAIGGFFVLRWAWCRWNELRMKKKPSNEEPPSSEDPTPPHS